MQRVLIIDDDKSIRDAIAFALTSLSFEPVSVGSAIEGIERAEQEMFDVVLADMHMPGINGLEVVKAISRLPQPVPVIAMSGGSASDDYLVLALAMGAKAFLQRPFRRDELLAAISREIGPSVSL